MRVVIQRSGKSQVTVKEKTIGEITEGLVVLVGFTKEDTKEKIEWMAKKIVNLRIFPDQQGVMNRSILEYGGRILLVSQFTLYANCQKGNRPSYQEALNGTEAKNLYEMFLKELKKYTEVSSGEFGADMEVSLINLGPTTICIER